MGNRRFLTLQDATEAEVRLWKEAVLTFARKLTLRYNRPLVLKSPANTGRIRLLLEMFPGARFVHIHRHPHTVFASTMHTWEQVKPWGYEK